MRQIYFYLNKEANILTETVVRETFQKWAELTQFKFTFQGRNRAGLIKDGKNTIYFLLRWPNRIPINKIAHCQNWYDDEGNIIESEIIFNMQVTKFTTLRTNKADSYYLEGVLAHEVGHMLGLAHIDIPDSIMKKKSPYQESFHKGKIGTKALNAYKKLYTQTQ